MKSLSCPNQHFPPSRKGDAGAIIRHGFYATRWGKRRRYQCRICGKTFCSTTRTPYHRLKHRRLIFDENSSFSVEGLNNSAIARVKRIAWNTVHRWLERAAFWSRRFSDRKICGFSVVELQADELRTIVESKEQPIWVFSAIDLWSRLWPATVVGRRCYYSFVRPHRALRFGREVRAPAMQAGLTVRRLTFREIFSSTMHLWALRNVTFVFFVSAMLVNVDNSRLSVAA